MNTFLNVFSKKYCQCYNEKLGINLQYFDVLVQGVRAKSTHWDFFFKFSASTESTESYNTTNQ